MKENIFSNQQVSDYLSTYYGIKNAHLTLLPIGADINASVYKGETEKQSYFIKLKRNVHHDKSSLIIELLHESGIKNIISPVKTKDGEKYLQVDNCTLIVSEFIDGTDGFSCDLKDDQWVTLGNIMRQIHNVDVPQSLQRVIRRENFSAKRRDAVRELYANIDSLSITDDISRKFTTFLKEHATVIHQLVDRAEQLEEQIQSQLPEFVLRHSDIHGGNVLLGENGKIYIVDWDDPIMAPKERDLMFIGGGVANVWNKPHELELFYKGYGKTKIDNTILAYYRQERIVEDIAEYSQLFFRTNEGNYSRTEAYNHFIAQFEPRGVVEIALETDKSLN